MVRKISVPTEMPADSVSVLEDSSSALEWIQTFRRRSVERRAPLSCLMELTSSCNLQCVHCYLGPQEEQRKKRSLEMPTARVKEVIAEIARSGCLYLTITGGDPMVRKDFPEIYRFAKEQGLVVAVFCDGILVTEPIVELFKEYPPQKVDISVYGATAETYEKVTRVKGSYVKFRRGLERLRQAGIRIGLKTVLMSINKHEVPAMRQLAAEMGVPFRVDSAIFPCLPTHDHEPLDLRLDPKEAAEIELSDPDAIEGWLEYASRFGEPPKSDTLYHCGAGVTGFYVDPLGYASPCLMTTHYRYSLADKGFEALWRNELVQLRQKKGRPEHECGSCSVKMVCNACPAFNYLENGAEDRKSQYVCDTTQHRVRLLDEARRVGSATAVARRLSRRRALEPANEPS